MRFQQLYTIERVSEWKWYVIIFENYIFDNEWKRYDQLNRLPFLLLVKYNSILRILKVFYD